MVKVIRHKNKNVVQVNGGQADYVVDNGRLYSVNGGYFETPQHSQLDWCRWEVDLDSPFRGEQAVIDEFKKLGEL